MPSGNMTGMFNYIRRLRQAVPKFDRLIKNKTMLAFGKPDNGDAGMAAGQFKEGIAAARLSPEQYAENFSDLHPPLDRHEALVEADRCYFCHDAPCMTGLPDLDRHSAVHPPDLDRQSARRGQDNLRPEHPGRHVRPRLPDRDAVRRSLRARDRRGQAGARSAFCSATPPTSPCGEGKQFYDRAPRLPARRSPSSARARRALPAPTVSPCTAMP